MQLGGDGEHRNDKDEEGSGGPLGGVESGQLDPDPLLGQNRDELGEDGEGDDRPRDPGDDGDQPDEDPTGVRGQQRMLNGRPGELGRERVPP